MTGFKRLLRSIFERAESPLDRLFGAKANPLYHLGALGFLYYWIVAVSGIYVYILFDTGTVAAYASVEYMTYEEWYLGGIMRSLHRYASDAMVLVMGIHIVREFALDRLRGPRWFTWVTGAPILWLVIVSGITGYWLVWDKLAQYVAIATTEWLDWLPIFGESIARNFLSGETLNDRFFSLLVFIHIAVPLILLFVLWIHLQRVSRPRMTPSRSLIFGNAAMLLALSLVLPAESQGPADLASVPAVVGLDWFYLAGYPVMDLLSDGAVWGFAGTLTVILCALPWIPPVRSPAPAEVDLENCNGCGRCAEDCPYAAIGMLPRTDGLPFEREAVVDPALCVSCGICAGACPTGTPFRRGERLKPGIDLPEWRLIDLRDEIDNLARALDGAPSVAVFACDHGAPLNSDETPGAAVIQVPCIGAVPPSFFDYVLSRGFTDGVFLSGCRAEACYHRLGEAITTARIARERDPRLRARVERARIGSFGGAATDGARLARALGSFMDHLSSLPAEDAERQAPCAPAAAEERVP